MSEFKNLEQELSESIAAIDAPCGCGDKNNFAETNPFADFASSNTLYTELEDALESMRASDVGAMQALSADEALAFSALGNENQPGLESIIAVLEKYPGLKITISY